MLSTEIFFARAARPSAPNAIALERARSDTRDARRSHANPLSLSHGPADPLSPSFEL